MRGFPWAIESEVQNCWNSSAGGPDGGWGQPETLNLNGRRSPWHHACPSALVHSGTARSENTPLLGGQELHEISQFEWVQNLIKTLGHAGESPFPPGDVGF